MVLLCLMLGSMITIYNISINAVYDSTSEFVKNTISQVNTDMDSILSNAIEQGNQVARDVDIQKTLRVSLPSDVQEIYKIRVNYNYILYDRNRMTKDISGIFVIGENGSVYRSTTYGLKDEIDFTNEEWYKNTLNTGQITWIPPHEGSCIVNNLDISTISVIVPIEDRASTKLLGVVVVEIETEELLKEKNSGLIFEGEMFMLNDNNEVIYSNSQTSDTYIKSIEEALDKISLTKDGYTEDIKINREKYLISAANLKSCGWKTVGIISHDKMYEKIYVIRITIIIFVSIFILLSVSFAIIASNKISNPIRDIRTKMKKVENGNFNAYVSYVSNDEIGELAHSFNHMINKINRLIIQEQENQKKLRQAEYKALQSQINPHFLYNTLDSILWMVRMNRLNKMEEMITSLTNFLRIGLSRGRDEILIEEELKHIENYITIQKIRYSRLLNYSVSVPENIKRYSIIKMTLQPIVENALYHGIKEKGAPGIIEVTAWETETEVIIKVSDDGMGMTAERLHEVETMMKEGIDFNPKAYGIINVQKRIQINYGNQYGLKFESEYTQGTNVYVTIPKRGGDVHA